MSEIVYVGRNAKTAKKAPQFDSYTRVVLQVSDSMEYVAGEDTGETLTLTNPFGTQAMCDGILAQIRGYAYQPLEATKTELDPAAELGDGVTVADTFSGLYKRYTKFGKRLVSDIAAPGEKEIDHEIPYKSKENREVTRRIADTQATLKIQADTIAAKVDARGGNESMGWELVPGEFRVTARGSTVLRVDQNGAYISGEVEAKSGKIGDMTLKGGALTTNGMTWDSTLSYGLYFGPNGIKIGQNFRVDSAGNLYAATGTFTGKVNAGNIQYGGNSGTFNGAGLTGGSVGGGAIMSGGLTTTQMSGGINTSLGYANFAHSALNGRETVQLLVAQEVQTPKLSYRGKNMAPITIFYMDWGGNKKSLTVYGG